MSSDVKVARKRHRQNLPQFTWQIYREYLSWRLFLAGLACLLMSISVGVFLIVKVPYANTSLISFIASLLHSASPTMQGPHIARSLITSTIILTIIGSMLLLEFVSFVATWLNWQRFTKSRYYHPSKFLLFMAMSEEVIYRKGSQDWPLRRRIKSCITFGLWHFLNLVVPLGALAGLALAGGVFMWVYLRAFHRSQSESLAVLESAIVHTTYNLIVAGILLSLISFIILAQILQQFGYV